MATAEYKAVRKEMGYTGTAKDVKGQPLLLALLTGTLREVGTVHDSITPVQSG